MGMKIKNNQAGVAHLAAILAVVVIAVVGLVGWKVWDNSKDKKQNNTTTNNSSNTKMSSPSTTDDKENTKTVAESKNAVGLTETEKQGILAAAKAYCQKMDTTKTASVTGNLDDSQLTKKHGDFVSASLGCLFNGEALGSGRRFILQNSAGWTVLSAGQMEPDCTVVDGKNMPADITQCYDTDAKLRDPR